MPEWGDEHKALVSEVCKERGVTFPEGFEVLLDDAREGISDTAWDITARAEADLTRTESGFLTSYEWGVLAENPERAELKELIENWGGCAL